MDVETVEAALFEIEMAIDAHFTHIVLQTDSLLLAIELLKTHNPRSYLTIFG